jgi:hypothetical protein
MAGSVMKFLFYSPWLIAGLPWTAWLLWIASIGIGLAIVVIFYIRHSRSRSS